MRAQAAARCMSDPGYRGDSVVRADGGSKNARMLITGARLPPMKIPAHRTTAKAFGNARAVGDIGGANREIRNGSIRLHRMRVVAANGATKMFENSVIRKGMKLKEVTMRGSVARTSTAVTRPFAMANGSSRARRYRRTPIRARRTRPSTETPSHATSRLLNVRPKLPVPAVAVGNSSGEMSFATTSSKVPAWPRKIRYVKATM